MLRYHPGMEIKMHEYQIAILRELLFKPEARFTELKTVDTTNDHFTFHVNALLKAGLVQKINGIYSLTDAGKEFANRMDTESLKVERQAKLAIATHAVREKNGQTEYLIHKRLKEPFYGWYGSQSGKIRWGETPEECARREFLEETGLTGDFTLKAIIHYPSYHVDGRLLEDKYFWVYRVDNVQGELKEKVPEGENIWMTEEEFRKLPNTLGTFEGMHKAVTSKSVYFEDKQKIVDTY